MKPSRSHHSSSCNSSFRARRSRNPVDLHRYPEAQAQSRAADALTGDDPAANVALIRGIADPAQRVRAVQILEASQASGGLTQGLVRAMFLMRLDERDRALQLLDDAAADGTAIPQLLWFHVFDPVRNDPRFKAALKKVGLPYTPRDVPTQQGCMACLDVEGVSRHPRASGDPVTLDGAGDTGFMRGDDARKFAIPRWG